MFQNFKWGVLLYCDSSANTQYLADRCGKGAEHTAQARVAECSGHCAVGVRKLVAKILCTKLRTM